jgi:hypothetical protein
MYPIILDESFVITDGKTGKISFKSIKRFSLSEILSGIIDEISYLGPPELKNLAIQEIKDISQKYRTSGCLSKQIEHSGDKFCTMCGMEARYPSFNKPSDICIDCFKKIKEN